MPVERLAGESWASPWREEHQARYLWASEFTRGAQVLDIACGSGFGVKILLERGAARVVAADLSEEALLAAEEALRPFGDRAEVRKVDALEMSLEDGTFDAVTSMETLEHLPDPLRFVSEAARVLRPGGILALSTPNALVTLPEGGKPTNPFHMREYSPTELAGILHPHFRVLEVLGQHLPRGYGVAPFLPSFHREELSQRGRLNFFYWRTLLRLGPLRDPIHRMLTGFPFFPRGQDYTFRAEDLERAHVQVVLAVKAEGGNGKE